MADKQLQKGRAEGENEQKTSKETKPSEAKKKEKRQKTNAPPNAFPPSAHQDQRINGIIEIGPVMKVGDVLGYKPGDPPIHYKERLVNPTFRELHKYCTAKLDAQKDRDEGQKSTSPVFGPERPPEEK